MIFVHCSKSALAIGQNRSREFWLLGNNGWFDEKGASLKIARSEASRKLISTSG